ncbi:MAG: NfeD family protein [Coriobacteriales bacterium]|jgi:membrane protein implicated in regulation of membrane protease activity
MTYGWLIIAAVMAIIEVASMGLITLWFVIGGVAAFIVQFAGGPLWLQIVVFIAVSLVCLALLRPVIMKNRKRGEQHEATPVGLNAIVVEQIDNDALVGRVETPDHMTWAAVSADGSVLPEGTRVRVVDQQSIKLVVERI